MLCRSQSDEESGSADGDVKSSIVDTNAQMTSVDYPRRRKRERRAGLLVLPGHVCIQSRTVKQGERGSGRVESLFRF